jgi:hypothetical protein
MEYYYLVYDAAGVQPDTYIYIYISICISLYKYKYEHISTYLLIIRYLDTRDLLRPDKAIAGRASHTFLQKK